MLPSTHIVFLIGLASATFGTTTQTAMRFGLRAYAHELSGCLDTGSETHDEIEEAQILCALDRVLLHLLYFLARCIAMCSLCSSDRTSCVSSTTSMRTANPGRSPLDVSLLLRIVEKVFNAGWARGARLPSWLVNWASNFDNFERQVLCRSMVQCEAKLHMVSSET